MFVKTEINDFETIAENAWSGAIQVCNEVIRQCRKNEAMCLIEDIFAETMPSATELGVLPVDTANTEEPEEEVCQG